MITIRLCYESQKFEGSNAGIGDEVFDGSGVLSCHNNTGSELNFDSLNGEYPSLCHHAQAWEADD
ncbi:hypothetical protein VH86_07765 [Pantoea sp. BL1]|nr:hypothetical protein VH86_07765 [Pantoea sp. BL1]